MSPSCVSVPQDAVGQLSCFRADFYDSLTGRADALFELTDALLCTDGPVKTLVGLALAPEHRRGHGALYGGLDQGRIEVARLRRVLASVPLPRAADGRLVLAVDVSPWLRPDAATSDARSFCHTYGRGENKHLMIPGRPCSWIVALETGRSSWTAPLDAVRLRPGDDLAAVTATQVRDLVERLITAGQWHKGDPLVWIVVDAGYDVMRPAYLLRDLPVELLGRLRSDRVMRRPAPPRVYNPKGGCPPRHGSDFIFKDTRTRGDPKPLWLWWSRPTATPAETDLAWQAFLRRFDIEHFFRMIKQNLGWTAPKLRDPEAADNWTWLVIAAYTQLRLARPLAIDLRRPWERAVPSNRLTPARVRRGFRHLRAKISTPAGVPKPSRPGPGRPPGSKNRHLAERYDVGLLLVTGELHRRPTHHKTGTKPRRTG